MQLALQIMIMKVNNELYGALRSMIDFIYLRFNKIMINQYRQDEQKGLFTFYREQAAFEDELRKQKRERKLEKLRLKKQKEMERQPPKKVEQEKPETHKQQQKNTTIKVNRKPLYQPKYKNTKIGQSVIIVSTQKNSNSPHPDKSLNKNRESLRKIEEMINCHNHNRYFLQNREMPIAFGNSMIQKEMMDQDEENKPTAVKLRYFNQNQEIQMQQNKRQELSNFSYEKLPQINKRGVDKQHSEAGMQKKYKSHKVEQALKSGNSQIIRAIRKNIKEQSLLHRLRERPQPSIIDFSRDNQVYEEETSRQKSPHRKKISSSMGNIQGLNKKQRKLVQIIHNNYLKNKKW